MSIERESYFDHTQAWSTLRFALFLVVFCAGGMMLRAVQGPGVSHNDFCKDAQGRMSYAQLRDGKSFCPLGTSLVTIIFRERGWVNETTHKENLNE